MLSLTKQSLDFEAFGQIQRIAFGLFHTHEGKSLVRVAIGPTERPYPFSILVRCVFAVIFALVFMFVKHACWLV